MDYDSIVQNLELIDHGKIYRASYYIKAGVLHADLAGMRQMTICMGLPAADMVRALLAERILQISTKFPPRQ